MTTYTLKLIHVLIDGSSGISMELNLWNCVSDGFEVSTSVFLLFVDLLSENTVWLTTKNINVHLHCGKTSYLASVSCIYLCTVVLFCDYYNSRNNRDITKIWSFFDSRLLVDSWHTILYCLHHVSSGSEADASVNKCYVSSFNWVTGCLVHAITLHAWLALSWVQVAIRTADVPTFHSKVE